MKSVNHGPTGPAIADSRIFAFLFLCSFESQPAIPTFRPVEDDRIRRGKGYITSYRVLYFQIRVAANCASRRLAHMTQCTLLRSQVVAAYRSRAGDCADQPHPEAVSVSTSSCASRRILSEAAYQRNTIC